MKGGEKMKIKKISEKLSFDVEAQRKCPDGKTSLFASCATDCKKVNWSYSTAILWYFTSKYRNLCKKSTTYSCSTSHML